MKIKIFFFFLFSLSHFPMMIWEEIKFYAGNFWISSSPYSDIVCVCVWDSTFQQLCMFIIIFQSTIINWSCVNIVLCVFSFSAHSLPPSFVIFLRDNINLWGNEYCLEMRRGSNEVGGEKGRQKCSISGNFCAISVFEKMSSIIS